MEKKLTYIHDFLQLDHPILDELAQQGDTRRDIEPNVGVDAGKMLGLLIRLIGAKRVVEFGTCIGYSAISMGQALKETGGKLITVEYSEKLYQEAKENIRKAKLTDIVQIIHGDAAQVIDQLEGPFDLILQDSAKPLYPELLEKIIRMVRKQGLIIADDTLFKPMGIPEKLSDPIDEYNKLVFSDDRLYTTMLPIGDGLTVSVKLND